MQNDQSRSLLELLYQVSREVASTLDLRTVLQRILYAAISNVGGERGSIIVIDDHGKSLDSVVVHKQQVQNATTRQRHLAVEHGLAGWVIKNKEAALVPDTSQDKRWLRYAKEAQEEKEAKSVICVPLMVHKKIMGILSLVHSKPNTFDKSHLELIQAIADQTGVAILNARLYADSQRHARAMTALADGAITINASLKTKDVFEHVLNQTMQALQVETVALALKESSGGDFVFRAAMGNQAEGILGKHIPKGNDLVTRVTQDGRGIIIPALTEDYPYAQRDFFDGIDTNALAIAPIQAQGKVIGVLEAINPISGVFGPDALLVMNGIGSLAGTTIQNAQLFGQVEETRKRYYELFNDNVDPSLVSDWDGNILEANRKLFSLSGYDANTLRSMKVDDIHEISWESVGSGFDYLDDDHTASYEATLRVKNGEGIPVEVYLRNAHLGKEQTIHWTFRDIRERKALDALRDDLSAMIYHDLRSPLSNVISSLDVLGNLLKDQDETIETLLRIANNSTARMQRLISSLLDINRLETGQPIVTQQGVSPGRLIHESLEEVSPSTKGRRQQLETNVAENLPNIWVDEDMIRRVLINLLENASKFTPAEGKLEIGAKLDGEWVQIWVADNGIGVPPEDSSRIFEKFVRTKKGKKVSGLGVGLAFCRLAVDGHGGKIWVDSSRKIGTRFNINLPTKKLEL